MYNTHEFIHGFVGALKFALMKKMIPLIWALLLSFMATGQKVPTGLEEILHALRSLQKETRVLYLAAHPDDENTRLISWLTHGAGVETALSVPDKGKRRSEPDRSGTGCPTGLYPNARVARGAKDRRRASIFHPGRGFWLQQESRRNLFFLGQGGGAF